MRLILIPYPHLRNSVILEQYRSEVAHIPDDAPSSEILALCKHRDRLNSGGSATTGYTPGRYAIVDDAGHEVEL